MATSVFGGFSHPSRGCWGRWEVMGSGTVLAGWAARGQTRGLSLPAAGLAASILQRGNAAFGEAAARTFYFLLFIFFYYYFFFFLNSSSAFRILSIVSHLT